MSALGAACRSILPHALPSFTALPSILHPSPTAPPSPAALVTQTNEMLEGRLNESTEQLASVSATLTAKAEETEKLASEKHEVEVEYKSYQEHHGTSNQQQMAAISELKLTVDRLNQSVESKSSEANVAQGSLAQQAAYLAEMESKLNQQESLRVEPFTRKSYEFLRNFLGIPRNS